MAATSVFEMASAVRELVLLERKRLAELDELTIRQGHDVDGGLTGLRLLVARTDAGQKLLQELAPHEGALRVWLEAKRVGRIGIADLGAPQSSSGDNGLATNPAA